MTFRYSKSFLKKLQHIFRETGFIVRYEKGNFQSGYCILEDKKVIIINKFYTLEGKINCLLEILKQIPSDFQNLSSKDQKLLQELAQMEILF